MMLAKGEIVKTVTGRSTTPFPAKSIKAVDKWLQDNVLSEAKSRNDDHIVLMFQDEKPGKFPTATREMINSYLFGFREPF